MPGKRGGCPPMCGGNPPAAECGGGGMRCGPSPSPSISGRGPANCGRGGKRIPSMPDTGGGILKPPGGIPGGMGGNPAGGFPTSSSTSISDPKPDVFPGSSSLGTSSESRKLRFFQSSRIILMDFLAPPTSAPIGRSKGPAPEKRLSRWRAFSVRLMRGLGKPDSPMRPELGGGALEMGVLVTGGGNMPG
jgi:hypothetical protein